MFVVGLLVALVLLAACAYASHLLAARLVPQARISARLAAASIIAYVLLVAVFLLLSLARAFRPVPALAAWVGIALAVHWRLGRRGAWRQEVARDLAGARQAWADAGWARWLLLATFPVALRVARGLVSPPMGWDALTYHLAKAGMWVQAGGFVPLPGPDTNRWYDQFPAYGDVLWAWAILPVHGDALLSLAGAAVWSAAVLATYACAREVGAAPRGALLGALVVGTVPACASYVTTSYVDNVVLGAFLVAALFLLRTLRHQEMGNAAVAGAALGAMAGTKSTGLLVVGAAVCVLVLAARRTRLPGRILLLVPVLACAIGATPYVRAWVATGSPLYPFPVSIAGRVVFPAAPGVLENWAERTRELPDFSLFLFGARLATPIPLVPQADRMGFGPGILLLFPLAVVGTTRLIRARGAGAAAVLAALSAGLAVSQLGAPWVWIVDIATVQRYVLGMYAALALASAVLEEKGAQVAVAAVAICGAALALPRGVGPVERQALLDAAPALGLAGAAAMAAAFVVRKRPLAAMGVAVAGMAVAVALIAPTRARVRYRVYEDAAVGRSFDPHGFAAGAWPIWEGLDAVAARRIAVAAGYDLSPNWQWFPLFGSRLQNEVLYVPITSDGSLLDYRDSDAVKDRGDNRAWLERLVAARVDEVVLLAPPPPEASWVTSAPEIFEPNLAAHDGSSASFRFRAERARELLRRPPCTAGSPELPLRSAGKQASRRDSPACLSPVDVE